MSEPERPDFRPTLVLLGAFVLVVVAGIVTVLLPGLRSDPDDAQGAETAGESPATPEPESVPPASSPSSP